MDLALYEKCGERTTTWWNGCGAANKRAFLINLWICSTWTPRLQGSTSLQWSVGGGVNADEIQAKIKCRTRIRENWVTIAIVISRLCLECHCCLQAVNEIKELENTASFLVDQTKALMKSRNKYLKDLSQLTGVCNSFTAFFDSVKLLVGRNV